MSESHGGETNLAKRSASAGRTMVSFAAVLCASMLPSPALAFNLVTEQEAKASALYEAANPVPELAARAFDPMGPRIDIVSPDLGSGAPLQSPLAIIVRFQSPGGAEILPESFRARQRVQPRAAGRGPWQASGDPCLMPGCEAVHRMVGA